MHSFYGNFGVLVRALAYLLTHGAAGLSQVSRTAILNANYLMRRLAKSYELPHPGHCMHEFVLSGRGLRKHGVRTLDVAKRLLDYGFYAPTIYFPLVVKGAIMIEPTETESKETLDDFADAMIAIARQAEEEPEKVREAPHRTWLGRLDETRAARRPVLRWRRSLQACGEAEEN